MAKEYIDKELAINEIIGEYPDAHYPSWYAGIIKNIPSADVVEVVRKAVKGYEGKYEVDQFGRVYSVDRVMSVNDNGRRYDKCLKGKQLRQTMHSAGYKVIGLSKNGETKTCYVHRIVAEAFVPNPDNLPMVNHKDEDRTNNFVENLEWCTNEYNLNYGNAKKKRIKRITGVLHTEEHKNKIAIAVKKHRRKNAELKFEYDGEMLSIPELSEKLNVSQKTLRQRYYRTGNVFLCSYGERRE